MKPVFYITFVFSLAFFSCGSSPKNELQAENHLEGQYSAQLSESVSIALPPKKEKKFFSGIPEEAVNAVENGSPESINLAYSILRKNAEFYTENEKILLNTAYSFMTILWQQEKVNFQPFEGLPPNPYTGAIESAKRGIYDESTGSSDFLTLVLPSLLSACTRISFFGIKRKSRKRCC